MTVLHAFKVAMECMPLSLPSSGKLTLAHGTRLLSM